MVLHAFIKHMHILVIQNNCPGIMAHNCMTAGIVTIKIWGRVARFDEVVQNEQIVPVLIYVLNKVPKNEAVRKQMELEPFRKLK